jgi:RNA polymerase sigma-70 factor (ECF subfamily)
MIDAELVSRTREGCVAAREALARRWSVRALAICRARVSRWDVAEDLAQETLIRALAHLPALDCPENFGAWLRGIAVRVCADWFRKRNRRRSSSSMWGRTVRHASQQNQSAPQGDVDDCEQRLVSEIDKLPDELKETILLHYFDDLTYEEIGQLLSVSRATVNARLAKARSMLARRLLQQSRCDDELP